MSSKMIWQKSYFALTTLWILLLPLSTQAFNLLLSFPPAVKGNASLLKVDPPNKIKTIVIDAGHGGHDPGCSGGHTREKHLALAIAKKLAKNLKDAHPDLRIILTRDSDVFIPLHERAAIANRNQADLFISIHCNYMPGSKATKGTETYVMGLHTADHNLNVAKRENSAILLEQDYEKNYDYDPNSPEGHILLSMYQNAFLERSIRFAQLVEDKFHYFGRKSRGVKQAGFVVLKETTMPSVLIEAGFLSSPSEEDWLDSEEGQNLAAGAIQIAFEQYKYEVEEGIIISDEVTPLAQTSPKPPVSSSLSSEKIEKQVSAPIKKEQKQEAIISEAPQKIGGSPYALRNDAPVTDKIIEQAKREVSNTNPTYTQHPSTTIKPYQTPAAKSQNRKLIINSPASSQVPSSRPASNFQSPPSYQRPPVAVMQPKVTADEQITAKGLDNDQNIFFYVQLAASPRPLDTQNGKWRQIDYQIEVVQEDKLFKYQARNFANYQAAESARLKLQLIGFPDAWIVAYKDGKRVSTQSALDELQGK